MKTRKELAQDALAVQDACNLCGVAQGFARAMIDLGEHTNGTDQRNTHPITKAWVEKLAYLSGGSTPYTLFEAAKTFDTLEEWARGEL